MNRDLMENWLQLWGNPLFSQRFFEFFTSMQQVGLEAARKSWAANYRGDAIFGNATDLFEPMIAFYSSLGFVRKEQLERVVDENEQLKKENEFLKKTLHELNMKIFTDGSHQVQQMWTETAQKQMEMSAGIAKEFFDLFKQQGAKIESPEK